MITDIRDLLLSAGGATGLTALAGLALHNDAILTVGLNSTGIVLLAYAGVALTLAVANLVTVTKTVVGRFKR